MPRDIVQAIEKAHGKGSIGLAEREHVHEPIACIPTGSMGLDAAIGVGGYPRGRIVELFGPDHASLRVLLLHAIRSIQAAAGLASFIDMEHGFDSRLARLVDVNLGKLLVSQPDHAEQAFDIAETLTRSGAVDLIVVDSTSALVPAACIEGDHCDLGGLQARLTSQAMRKLAAAATRSGATLIFATVLPAVPGATALKFYAGLRIDVCRMGPAFSAAFPDLATGQRVRARVVKNKVSAPFADCEFEIGFDGAIVS